MLSAGIRAWRRSGRGLPALCLAALVAGCGGGGGGGGGGETGRPGADYFPLAVGDRWSYLSNGVATTVRVDGTRDVGGSTGYVIRIDEPGLSGQVIYTRSATAIRAIAAPNPDPVVQALNGIPVLRLPIVSGNRFVELDQSFPAYGDLDNDGRPETLRLRVEVAVLGFETLATPVGSFTDVAHVQTVVTQSTTYTGSGQNASASFSLDDWYAPDIGPVRNLTVVGSARSEDTLRAFRVGALASERIAPKLVAIEPADGSVLAPPVVRMAFDEPMDVHADTNVGFSLTGPNGDVPGFVFWLNEQEAFFAPAVDWVSGAYTARFDGSAEDLAGNPVGTARGWSFTVDVTLAAAAVGPAPRSALSTRTPGYPRTWRAPRLLSR